MKREITAALFGAAALATPAPVLAHEQSVALAYVGVLDLNRLDTRVYAGGFIDAYTEGNVGIHADIVHVDREENATYFSGGVSFDMGEHIRPKLMIGTSTSNRSILPDLFASFSVRIKPGDNSGWIVTPGLAYRHYRDRQEETIGSLAVAKYFNAAWDSNGYYAAQLAVATSITAHGDPRASVTAGLQTVRKSGVMLGLTGEAGSLVRDPVAGTPGYRGRYWALRPNLSVPLFDKVEWVARGEYADTQLYDAVGGSTGVKVAF